MENSNQTPTHEFLDDSMHDETEWLQKDLMMFENQAEAEEYLRDDMFGTDGQGLIQEIIEYQG